jgi:RNA polymerase-binding transcription factor DksA
MPDDCDLASDLQQKMNDVALENFRRQRQMTTRKRIECIDCDEPIEPQRLALLGTERCINCQIVFEGLEGKKHGHR